MTTSSLNLVERIKAEFFCTECKKYFDIKLNITLNGNIRVHCPDCSHIHFRKIENGIITDTRFDNNDSDRIIEDLRPMKASCRDFQKEKAIPQERRFLHDLWHELFSANV